MLSGTNSRTKDGQDTTTPSQAVQHQQIHGKSIEPLHRGAFNKARAALSDAQKKLGSRPIPPDEHESDSDYSSSSETKSTGTAAKMQKGFPPPQKITEDDLRAMAQFRAERPPSPHVSANGKLYWTRFARHAEVCRPICVAKRCGSLTSLAEKANTSCLGKSIKDLRRRSILMLSSLYQRSPDLS